MTIRCALSLQRFVLSQLEAEAQENRLRRETEARARQRARQEACKSPSPATSRTAASPRLDREVSSTSEAEKATAKSINRKVARVAFDVSSSAIAESAPAALETKQSSRDVGHLEYDASASEIAQSAATTLKAGASSRDLEGFDFDASSSELATSASPELEAKENSRDLGGFDFDTSSSEMAESASATLNTKDSSRDLGGLDCDESSSEVATSASAALKVGPSNRDLGGFDRKTTSSECTQRNATALDLKGSSHDLGGFDFDTSSSELAERAPTALEASDSSLNLEERDVPTPMTPPSPSEEVDHQATFARVSRVSQREARDSMQDYDTESQEWWFHLDKHDNILGPFTPWEMRRLYVSGLIGHTTMVRWLPVAYEKPQAYDQPVDGFSPLQEMCSDHGPPFIDAIADAPTTPSEEMVQSRVSRARLSIGKKSPNPYRAGVRPGRHPSSASEESMRI